MAGGLRNFLAEVKLKLPLTGTVHAVIGNEASDADSIVSAITMAYLRHHTQPTELVMPVVPCARRDIAFRPETVQLLKMCQIPLDELIHVDDVDLTGPFGRGQLRLTLTDHNTGSLQEKAGLADAVVEIVDHHQDMGGQQHLAKNVRRISYGEAEGFEAGRGLGSVCTLVTEMFLAEAPELLDSCVSSLLAGVILLDTNNCLNPTKVTPRDVAAVGKLLEVPGVVATQDDLYQLLQEAKTSPEYWAAVGTYDMLRSDFKGFATGLGERMFGISSINGGAGDLLELVQCRGNDDIQMSFAQWASETQSEVLIAMCCYPHGEGGWNTPKRDLMVYSASSTLRDAMIQYLSQQDLLQLHNVETSLSNVELFRQLNIKSSRKQVQPLVSQFYEQLKDSNL